MKSDDVSGRTKVYEAIVREQDTFEAGVPESFNVLVKELKSLGLNVDLDNARRRDARHGDAGPPSTTGVMAEASRGMATPRTARASDAPGRARPLT